MADERIKVPLQRRGKSPVARKAERESIAKEVSGKGLLGAMRGQPSVAELQKQLQAARRKIKKYERTIGDIEKMK